jgi:trehalose synthase-fused probable maltokinase
MESKARPSRRGSDALTALVEAAAAALERELPERRWFGDKARAIAKVTALDHVAVPGGDGVLALVRVDFTTGLPATYCVPMANLGDRGGMGAFADALDDPAFGMALVEQIRRGATLPGRTGRFRFSATDALAAILPAGAQRAARVGTEQSNTSVILDGRAILKVIRRLEPGPNPEFEITDFLTRATHFHAAPKLVGSIEYETAGEEATTLATLQEFVPNHGDVWAALTIRLGEYFAVAVTGPEAGGHPDPAFARALAAADAREARILGELTGRLHMALASATEPPAMVPALVAEDDVRAWQEAMKARVERVLATLVAMLDRLPADVRDLARHVLDGSGRLVERAAALEALLAEPVLNIRVHGDYHLGQVLRTDGGFVIVDFEGEPARALAERRARVCALKDVAGMQRSFSYAARAAMLRAAEGAAADAALLERFLPWANAWETGARAAFLDGYLAETAARGAHFLPGRRDAIESVLEAYELDKAVYELDYELNHRPAWARIPLAALMRAAAPAPVAAVAPPRTDGPFRFVACVELHEFVGLRAEDERRLMELIEQVPLDSIYYHTHGFFLRHKFLAGIYPNDFATWAAVHVRDQALGERLAMVDPAEFADLEALRDHLVSTIDEHLRRLHIVPRIASAAEPFDFVRSRIVEIPTGIEASTLEEFRQALLDVDISAVYFHLVEARMRLGRDQNDFAAWLDRALGLARLAAQVRDVNPYGVTLERTRARLIQRCDEAIAEGGRP